jgi:hypothetical protein
LEFRTETADPKLARNVLGWKEIVREMKLGVGTVLRAAHQSPDDLESFVDAELSILGYHWDVLG